MGTRLYPQESDPSVLEKLINVPEGTYARLKDLQSAFDRTFGLTESYEPSYVKNPDATEKMLSISSGRSSMQI